VVTGPKQANAGPTNDAWPAVAHGSWRTPSCTNTFRSDWKNVGRRTDRRPQSAGLRPRQPSRCLSRQTIYNWIDDRARGLALLVAAGGRPPERRGRIERLCPHRRTAGGHQAPRRTATGRETPWWAKPAAARWSHWSSEEWIRPDRAGGQHERPTPRGRCSCRLKDHCPPRCRRSVTFDNGKEFAEHRQPCSKR